MDLVGVSRPGVSDLDLQRPSTSLPGLEVCTVLLAPVFCLLVLLGSAPEFSKDLFHGGSAGLLRSCAGVIQPQCARIAPGCSVLENCVLRRSSVLKAHGLQVGKPVSCAFDSRWVPPVGGAPSRHTSTGGAADGVHAQCLRDSGAGDRSRVVPRPERQLAAESSGAPKQAARQPDEAMSSRASG
jgi:hypothetical protein